MTWPGFLFALLVVAVLLYCWHQARPLLEKRIAVTEQKVAADIEAAKPAPVTPREALPVAIRQIAMGWRDEWAREQTMDYYCQLYDQSRDWNNVQTEALGDQARYLKA